MKKMILIVALTLFLIFVLAPPAANAHGARGFWPGVCVGGIFGWLLGRHIDVQPAQPPPPPPPRTCWRLVPAHWEKYWNPDGTLTQKLVPEHWEPFPCR